MATLEIEDKRIEEVLSFPILLSDRISQAAEEADFFKTDCAEVGKQADRLCQMLRSIARFNTSTTSSLYERPVRRIVADVSKNLDRALTLVRKCKRRGILRRVVRMVTAADFRKLNNLLESSIADMKWLLSISDNDGCGGGGMADHSSLAREEFARENVIRPLVTLLSYDIPIDEPKLGNGKQSIHSIVQINKELEKNSSGLYNYRHIPGSPLPVHYSDGSSKGVSYRKEKENEKPEMKYQLKVSCAKALWMLSKGSVVISKRITDTKGLLCLAKVVEREQGELQLNCLMTIMEITAAAESNADLRRAAFKTNSPAAKAVVDQLLKVIKESDNPILQIPAVRSVGSLARTFPARETRVIGPLVEQLSNRNLDVAAEAAASLEKFTCPQNFLCTEHSKTVIEYRGVPPLMRLLRGNERSKLHGLMLLCHLASHAGNSEALEQARVFTALEGVDRSLLAVHPELKELVPDAMYHLNVYHSGVLTERQYIGH
ncbi:hypothetical protein P3S67_027283 [Capsicum chacoense]